MNVVIYNNIGMSNSFEGQMRVAGAMAVLIAAFCMGKIGFFSPESDEQEGFKISTPNNVVYKSPAIPDGQSEVLLVKPSPVNINTASAEEIGKLPGIGPSIAKRVVEYRSLYGRFNSVDELMKVRGIGKKKLSRIKPLITL